MPVLRKPTSTDPVARVLAHADREITGVYDRYEYVSEKRTALERWAAHVGGLLHPPPVATDAE